MSNLSYYTYDTITKRIYGTEYTIIKWLLLLQKKTIATLLLINLHCRL